MSSTRSAQIGSPINQSRFASAREYRQELNGVLVAKRCAALNDLEQREILLSFQKRSLDLKGVEQVGQDFVRRVPEEFGMMEIESIDARTDSSGRVSGADVKHLLKHIPKKRYNARYAHCHGYPGCEWLAAAVAGDDGRRFPMQVLRDFVFQEGSRRFARDLLAYCVDPSQGEAFDVFWYLKDPRGAFGRYFEALRKEAAAKVAHTSVAEDLFDLLDFATQTQSMVLAEGGVRLGKTWAIRAWCEMNPGVARYVECPSTTDDRSFFAAVAEALGVANGTSYTGAQISARVLELLRSVPLMLVVDECHYALSQKIRASGAPARILWLKSLHDTGVPIALVGTTEFTQWLQRLVKKTGWSDGQFKGRLARYLRIPDLLSDSDLKKVALHLLPGAEDRTYNYLVGYALTAPSGVAGITQSLKAARYRAKKAGQEEVTHRNIEEAITLDMLPSENALATAMTRGLPREPLVSRGGSSAGATQNRSASTANFTQNGTRPHRTSSHGEVKPE